MPYCRRAVSSAVSALRAGELVIVPTSRWYMVCCTASSKRACVQIFQAKRRVLTRPLAFVAPHMSFIMRHFRLNRHATALARAFWPGNLALRLPWRRPHVSRHRYIGERVADVVLEAGVFGALARTCGPLATASLSLSCPAEPVAITASEVDAFIVARRVIANTALVGPVCPLAMHMTIVDCSHGDAIVLREGVVHRRAVGEVIGLAPQLRSDRGVPF